jgi:hypothetical protein
VLARSNNFPNKLIVGLVSSDFRDAYIFKISVEENKFIVVESHIPQGQDHGEGYFVVFPEPLKRIKEVILTKKFPTKDELPAHFRKHFKTNKMFTSTFHLYTLYNQEEYYSSGSFSSYAPEIPTQEEHY